MGKSAFLKIIMLLALAGSVLFGNMLPASASTALGEGSYTVGKEISAGLNKFSIAEGAAEFTIYKGGKEVLWDILDSDQYYGANQFTARLKAGDKVEILLDYGTKKVNVALLSKADLAKLPVGLYEAGVDFPAGSYQFKLNDPSEYGIVEVFNQANDYKDEFDLEGTGTKTYKFAAGDKVYLSNINGTISMKNSNVLPQSIALNKSNVSLAANQTVQLAATISPATATDKAVTWKSSNTSVATVDAKGFVKAVKPGTAKITATAKGAPAVTKSITVTVTKVVPTGISLNKSSLAIANNQTYKVTATVAPANAVDKTVVWKSSNTKVATVDSKGTVKGLASGSAVITATAKDNTKVYKTVNVTVSAKAVKLNKTALSVIAGQAATLTATVTPADSTPKTITWKSSNTKIATVDAKGKVTGKAKGTATITASVSGGKAATAKVTVTSPVAAQSVKLDKTAVTLAVGKTHALKATVSPSNTTNKAVTWKSSNTKIATVDSKGTVKAIAGGSAKITATTTNGKTVSATINVPYVKSLSAGTWKGGTHLPAGRYKITTNSGFGNLFVTPASGDLYINEILAGPNEDWGVQTVTTDIKKGDKIEILSLDSVQFTQVTNVKSNTLHAGHWTVGKDINAGRYRVTSQSGSGNLFIYRGSSLLVNEMLSSKKEPYYVTSVTQTLKTGDRIEISGMNKVVFTPSK